MDVYLFLVRACIADTACRVTVARLELRSWVGAGGWIGRSVESLVGGNDNMVVKQTLLSMGIHTLSHLRQKKHPRS